eukprot:tig00001154_g7305.t1
MRSASAAHTSDGARTSSGSGAGPSGVSAQPGATAVPGAILVQFPTGISGPGRGVPGPSAAAPANQTSPAGGQGPGSLLGPARVAHPGAAASPSSPAAGQSHGQPVGHRATPSGAQAGAAHGGQPPAGGQAAATSPSMQPQAAAQLSPQGLHPSAPQGAKQRSPALQPAMHAAGAPMPAPSGRLPPQPPRQVSPQVSPRMTASSFAVPAAPSTSAVARARAVERGSPSLDSPESAVEDMEEELLIPKIEPSEGPAPGSLSEREVEGHAPGGPAHASPAPRQPGGKSALAVVTGTVISSSPVSFPGAASSPSTPVGSPLGPSALESSESSPAGEGRTDKRRRDSHNEFERRRRDQINSKLAELKHLVPSLSNLVSNKATVLSKAIDYIAQLSNENTRANYHIHQLSAENSKAIDVINQLNDENSELRAQIDTLRVNLSQQQQKHSAAAAAAAVGTAAAAGEGREGGGGGKRARRDAGEQRSCVPDEVLKQFVASTLALTTRSLVVCDATHPSFPIIYASLGFQLMTGYAQEEVLGRNCNFLQGRNTSPLTRNVVRNALRDKQEVLVEILNYKKDGTPFWNLLFITPVLDSFGQAIYYMGLQFDITETKCVSKEQPARLAEYQHNPRVETVPGEASVLYVPNETLKHLIASALRLIMRNIAITDPKQSGNPIIYCTPGLCQMTGYSKEEILGRNGGFLQGPGSDPVTRSQIGKALRECRECLAEMLNYKKDGTPFWNLMFITPVLDTYGKPMLFIGVEYDITAR